MRAHEQPQFDNALEVSAANGAQTMIAKGGEVLNEAQAIVERALADH